MIDINSPTWKTVEAWAEAQIAQLKEEALGANSLEELGRIKGSVWVLQDLIATKNEKHGEEEPL